MWQNRTKSAGTRPSSALFFRSQQVEAQPDKRVCLCLGLWSIVSDLWVSALWTDCCRQQLLLTRQTIKFSMRNNHTPFFKGLSVAVPLTVKGLQSHLCHIWKCGENKWNVGYGAYDYEVTQQAAHCLTCHFIVWARPVWSPLGLVYIISSVFLLFKCLLCLTWKHAEPVSR